MLGNRQDKIRFFNGAGCIKYFSSEKTDGLFDTVNIFHLGTFLHAFQRKFLIPASFFFYIQYFRFRKVHHFSSRLNGTSLYFDHFRIYGHGNINLVVYLYSFIIQDFYQPVFIDLDHQHSLCIRQILDQTLICKDYRAFFFKNRFHFMQYRAGLPV